MPLLPRVWQPPPVLQPPLPLPPPRAHVVVAVAPMVVVVGGEGAAGVGAGAAEVAGGEAARCNVMQGAMHYLQSMLPFREVLAYQKRLHTLSVDRLTQLGLSVRYFRVIM